MQFRLELQLSAAEGALVRVLGMIERRGFTASAVHAERLPDGQWRLQMQVAGQRPGPTLALQLSKLYDCVAVSVQPAAASAADIAA